IEYTPTPNTDVLGPELSRVASLASRPTAIICHDDQTALRTIDILQKLRHKVPEDFSVTGFDNIPHLEFASPALTTIDPHLTELGGQMARMLLAQIRGEDIPSRRYIGKAQVIARKSTAPPRVRG
ncbi:MAG: LacI family transcriptional regulator, partial [Candidatus Marsarchaeota archaeon]|nr:LacI family transcriptional regulator [Candidatus Marsarchaeota archaeon]